MKVPNTSGAYMVVTAAVSKRCPFADETDNGTITLRWRAYQHTYELHQLRRWLDGYRDRAMTHEDFAAEVADLLSADVTTTWETAGMEVECSTWPTHPHDKSVTP